MNDSSAQPLRVPARLVLASICGLWVTYFLLTTLRGALLGYDFSWPFVSRRLLVTGGSMAVTALFWPLLVALARRPLWNRVALAMLAGLPAALLLTLINSWAFADLDHQARLRDQQEETQLRREQGVNILDDGEGNVVEMGNGRMRIRSDDGALVEFRDGKLTVRDGKPSPVHTPDAPIAPDPPAPPLPPPAPPPPPVNGEAVSPVPPAPPEPPALPEPPQRAAPSEPAAAPVRVVRVVRSERSASERAPSAPQSAPAATASAASSLAPVPKVRVESSFWDEYADMAIGRYFLLLAWMALYFALEAAQQARAAERREGDYRRAAQAAELRSLRYQINPHFLFNTLNSLSALVLTGKQDAAETMIQTLSTFYRRSLTGDSTGDVSLEEEIGLQRLYLEIEAVRFPERLRTVINVPLALAHAQVPGMILQPLVENSIKYGVAASRNPVTVTITAHTESDRLVLTVSDDGPGVPSGQDGCGIGLANVRDRLHARFDGKASLEAGPRIEGGYATVIRLPMSHGDEPRDPANADR